MSAVARPGEVLVSNTIVDLVAGSDLNFEDYEEDKKRRLGEDSVLPKRIKYKKFARA